MNKKVNKQRSSRWGESGNVFFTLFGAVALVGVVGVATSTLMRGPVGTVVRINQNAKADAQMQIAHKLAMLEAARQADSGDCDSDGFVEPLGPVNCGNGLTNGGCLPDTIGASQNDPWGTRYGYCAWNHGFNTISPACSDDADNANVLSGTDGSTETVIAVISAGPDRTFQTDCFHDNGGVDPEYVVRAGDDLVLDITYAGAVEASGGLWKLKSGDPDTAVIDKNVEARFSSASLMGDALNMARLEFGDNSMLELPNNLSGSFPLGSGDGDCNNANYGSLRINFSSGAVVQICDTANAWSDVGGAGSSAGAQGVDGSVQISDGAGGFKEDGANFNYAAGVLNTPSATLTGTLTTVDIEVTGDITDAGGAVTVNDDLDVTGNTVLSGTLRVDGDISDGLGDVRIDDNLVVTGTSDLQGNISDSTGDLTISDNVVVTGTSDFQGDVSDSVGDFTIADNLVVTGTSDLQGDISDSAGNVTVADALDITAGDVTVSAGDVIANAFRLDGDGAAYDEGIYYGSAAEMAFRTGGNDRLILDQTGDAYFTGDVGINLSGVPTASLDVDGEIRLRSSASYAAGNACSQPGMIAYSGSDELMICSEDTGNWETVGTSGGGGGGVGGVWTDEGNYIRYENYTYITNSGANLTFSSALEGAGTRMLWYTSAAALRAGQVTGSQWDDGNVGQYSVGFGLDTVASGTSSFAAGSDAEARSTNAIALGNEVYVEAGANNSMGLGLGDATGNAPQVFGTSSLGIFMGDQTDVDFTAANTMLLAGGKLVIDPNVPATKLAADGILDLDVEGDIGAIQYCDETGANCFTAEAVATGSVGVPGADTEILFNSGGSLGSDPGFVFVSSTNSLGLGTANPAAALHIYNGGSNQELVVQGGDANQSNFTLMTKGDGQTDLSDASTSGWLMSARGVNNGANAEKLYFSYNDLGAWNVAATFTSAGRFGLGAASPAAQLELTEQMLLGNIDDCTAATQGALRLNAGGDVLEMCDFAGSGGYISIGGASVSAPGADREIVFNSGGSLDTAANFVYTSAGYLGLGITAPAYLLDVGDVDMRMFLSNGGTALADTYNLGVQVGSTDHFELSTKNGAHRAALVMNDVDDAADTVLGFATSQDSGGSWNPGFVVKLDGSFGIGTSAPDTNLDVAGTLKIAYGSEACDASREGAVHYDATDDNFYVCQTNGSGWQRIITAGGGGGGLPAAGADTQIQFNSGNELWAAANFVYTSAGDLIVGSYQIDDTTNGTEDSRMYFDVSNVAFRAATAGGNRMDAANVGWASAAFGDNPLASGTYSLAAGYNAQAVGDYTFAMGENVLASNHYSTALGESTKAYGSNSLAGGAYSTTSGYAGFAYGMYSSAGGMASVSLGQEAYALGDNSVAFGLGDPGNATRPQVDGDRSFGIFMGAQDSVSLSAANTMGLFGGKMVIDPAVPATNLSADTALEIEGTLKIAYGSEACDAAREGAVHYDATDDNFYVCQTNGSGWQRIITAGGGGGGLPAAGADTQIQFNSGNELWAAANFVYTSAGDLIVGSAQKDDTTNPVHDSRMFFDKGQSSFRAGYVDAGQWDFSSAGQYSVAFGYNNTASGDASAAVGYENSVEAWGTFAAGDTNRITSAADYGVALGANNIVSSNYGMAFGDGNTASGYAGLAVGFGNTASALTSVALGGSNTASDNEAVAIGAANQALENNSIAIGSVTVASGLQSMALGREVKAGDGTAGNGKGNNSLAIGLGSGIATDPQVTGQRSLGVFMGAQEAVDMTANNTMGLFGGKMVIDPAVPATNLSADTALEIEGTLKIGYGSEACDASREGAIHYDAGGDKFYACLVNGGGWQEIATSGSGVGGLWTDNTDHISYQSVHLVNNGEGLPAGMDADGTRMFWLPNNAAFRGGRIRFGSDAWVDWKIGQDSFAFGDSVEASNTGTVATGRQTVASGSYAVAMGAWATASGNNSFAIGDTVYATDGGSVAMGQYTSATGYASTAIGDTNVASGGYSLALGKEATASGGYSIAMGREVMAGDGVPFSGKGDGSFALGLMDDSFGITTQPRVSGIQSFGIFMGDQDGGVDMTANNTMGLFGGSMVIDPAVPATNLSADTALEVTGSLKIAYGGEACDAAREGAFHYDATGDKFYVCATAGSWTELAMGTPTAAGTDRQIQFNSANSFAADANFVYTSAGDLVVGSTQKGDTTNPAHDDRMFFDKANAAFRAGSASGAQWNSANIGTYSIGLGSNAQAGGYSSVAIGDGADASTSYAVAIGMNTASSGQNSVAIGNGAAASGDNSLALGLDTQATDEAAVALGDQTQATGYASMAATSMAVASGDYSLALGEGTVASGIGSVALGGSVLAGNGTAGNGLGDGSMALGLIDNAVVITTKPQVTGIQSYGIFMGDQDGGVDMTANNTMGIFGGRMVIDPTVPSTVLAAQTGLDVDAAIRVSVDGEVCSGNAAMEGAIKFDAGTFYFCANQASDWESITLGGGSLGALSDTTISGPVDGEVLYYSGGGWVNQALSISDIAAAGSDRQIQFNSGNSFAAVDTFLYTSAGDFIVGSTQTSDTGNAAHDKRVFFDKSKGAFRAGEAAGVEWNDTNVGWTSFAAGYHPEASGFAAFAGGDSSVASGYAATAFGGYSVASGSYSFAVGESVSALGEYASVLGAYNTVSGDYGVALGWGVEVGNGTAGSGFGDHSAALGLGDPTGSYPKVTGVSSFGIFMGDQGGVDMTAANTMGLFGGKMVIDPNVPATNLVADTALDVLGAIKFASAGGTACDAAREGAIQYGSGGTKIFEVCADTANGWEQLALGGTVAGAFTDLSDTPAAFAGQAGKLVAVNSTPDGLEFIDADTVGIWTDEGGRIGYSNALGGARIAAVSGAASPVGATAGLASATVGADAILESHLKSVNAPTDEYCLTYEATGGDFEWQDCDAGAGGLWTAGSGDDIYYNSGSTPRIGIGNASPTVALDVTGKIKFSSSMIMGSVSGGATPLSSSPALNDLSDVDTTGKSTNDVLTWDGSNWIAQAGGGGSSLWTDNTTYITYNSAHFMNSGQTLPAGYDANGTRMFFYPDKAAFRGGYISGGNAAWQEANIGVGSFAYGQNPRASGLNSFAAGEFAYATGQASVALGGGSATGDYSISSGTYSTADGTASVGLGEAYAIGDYAVALGRDAYADGYAAVALGRITTAGGSYSTAMGHWTYAEGESSMALGNEVEAGADYGGTYTLGTGHGHHTLALGLQSGTPGTAPKVTGDRTMAVFMGNGNEQSSIDIAATDAVAFIGGNMVIDPRQSAGSRTANNRQYQDSDIRGVLDLGYATDALVLPSGTTAQEPSPVNGMLRYDTDTNKFRGVVSGAWADLGGGGGTPATPDRGIQFNSGNEFAADANFVYTSAGDFIVGSYQINDTTSGNEDARMFFDKSTSSFRAGQTFANNWDEVNIGDFSVAFGSDTIASGYGTLAVGDGSRATGDASVALGTWALASGYNSFAANGDTNATGDYSIALSEETWATGDNSLAIGKRSTASGWGSVAIGNYVIAGDGTTPNGPGTGAVAFGLTMGNIITTKPKVTGNQSFGIFMGDQDGGIDLASARTMGLFGGKMVIDPAVPATQLTARGVLDLGAATDALVLPSGTTAQEPSPVNGMLRYDTDTNKFRGVVSGAWADLGGGGALNDLSDVDTTGIAQDGILLYSAGSWVAGTLNTDSNLVGSLHMAAASNCKWTSTSNTWVSFTTPDADCSNATVTGSASVPSEGKIPAIKFANLPAGDYEIRIDVQFRASYGSSWVACMYRFSDGTNTSGSQYVYDNSSGAGAIWSDMGMTGNFSYATDQTDITFYLQADRDTGGGGTCSIENDWVGYFDMDIYVKSLSGTVSSGGGGGGGASALDDLTDVNTSGKSTNDVLTWNGSGWVAQAGGGGGLSANAVEESHLKAVNAPTDEYCLTYEATGGDFEWQSCGGGGGLWTAGAGDDIYYNTGVHHVGIGVTNPDVELDVDGSIEYTGTITDVSDMRLKKDITKLTGRDMLSRVAQVDTYTFRMKDDPEGKIEYGVMAQELEKLFPELVKTAKDEMGTKSVNYIGLIAPIIEASKELKAENDALKAELAELKTAQATFEADILREVNGLKAHTGYGISRAEIGLWMVGGMIGFGGIFFLIGGIIRNRQHKTS